MTDTEAMATLIRKAPKVRNALDVTHAALTAYGRAVRTLITSLADADADAEVIHTAAEHLSELDRLDRTIREATAAAVIGRRGVRK